MSLRYQKWMFGSHARLDFTNTPALPSVSLGPPGYNPMNNGVANICDCQGNLLFYTDGRRVWDAANVLRIPQLPRPVPLTLDFNDATQGALIVPDPANASKFYVFNVNGIPPGAQVLNGSLPEASLLDVSTWTASGVTISGNYATVGYVGTGKMVGVQARGCEGFYVITIITTAGGARGYDGPALFRVFHVSASGVAWVGDTLLGNNAYVHPKGYIKVSPQGDKIAVTNYNGQDHLAVYGFDNSTGLILGNPSVATFGPSSLGIQYGLEFSPSGRYVFVNRWWNTTFSTDIYRLDLLNPTNLVPCGSYAQPTGGSRAFGAMLLGPDGRIYVALEDEERLAMIENPDALSTTGLGACNLSTTFVTISMPGNIPKFCKLGLPNNIVNICDCASDTSGDCGCGCNEACDEATEDANSALGGAVRDKQFTVVANGQTPPSNCAPALGTQVLAPYFTLEWGDGPNDQFESDDTEIIYIVAHNPFTDVVFCDVKIFNVRVTPNQSLPNGDPSLLIVPSEIVCFDEVAPCSIVARDFTLLIRHAIAQGYQVTFDYCIGSVKLCSDATSGSTSFNIQVIDN